MVRNYLLKHAGNQFTPKTATVILSDEKELPDVAGWQRPKRALIVTG
jgi:hypothetical protein